MTREYSQHPLPGVAAVVWREGKALLVQRGTPPNYGRWSIPGGLIELGETAEQAVRREIREECGLEPGPLAIVTTVDIILHDPDQRIKYHYVILEWTGHWVAGEAQAGDDALSAEWFAPDEWADLDLDAETLRVLGEAQALAGRQ